MKTNIITKKQIAAGDFDVANPHPEAAGVVKKLDMADYLTSNAWGSHDLRSSNIFDGGCPHTAKFKKDNPGVIDSGDTPARRIGRIYHSYLLEPETFEKFHTVVSAKVQADILEAARARAREKAPQKFTKALASYKTWIAAGNLPEMLTEDIQARLLEAAQESKLPSEFSFSSGAYQDWKTGMLEAGKEIVTEAEMETMDQMRKSVLDDARCCELLSLKGMAEPTIFAPYSQDITLKVRPDWLPTVGHEQLDLKTAKDAHPDAFQRDIFNFGYLVQAAFHRDVCRMAGYDMRRFGWIVQEKEAPFAVSLQWATDKQLAWGREYYRGQLMSIQSYYDAGIWPKLPTNKEVQFEEWIERRMAEPIQHHFVQPEVAK